MSSFSSRTYRMHMQLTALLALQLLCPIVCIAMPVSILCLYSVFYGHALTLEGGEVGVTALALYATVNSLLTLLFVTPFRRYTANGLITCGRGMVGVVARLFGISPVMGKGGMSAAAGAARFSVNFSGGGTTNNPGRVVPPSATLVRGSICVIGVGESTWAHGRETVQRQLTTADSMRSGGIRGGNTRQSTMF